jgi:broad specificity phosphatase PhoE
MRRGPWVVPASTLRWLAEVPTDRPVAMLIRHSVRGHLDEGDAGYAMPLTEEGHALTLDLGAHLTGRLRGAHASPLLRTMQTAERLLEGAGLPADARPDTLLGDPGVFMLDHRAGPYWRTLGHERMMTHLVEGRPPLPGCASAHESARFLVHHMLAHAGDGPGITAYATHDSVVSATVARMLETPLTRADWPLYLDAAFFWIEDGAVQVAYQGRRGSTPAPLVSLQERDLIAFARREIAATIGLDCPARFFLAGGAFKTLLTGRAPRDLDLFCPSPEDRAAVEARLTERGALRLPAQPYTQGYTINGRLVELPQNTAPATLEQRLSRFDLSLSAVGVEHLPCDEWRAVLHPEAVASVASRSLWLIDEGRSWTHSLGSLERLRRYAKELDFDVRHGEEARIWAHFDAQPPEVQADMVRRFKATTRDDRGLSDELAARGR